MEMKATTNRVQGIMHAGMRALSCIGKIEEKGGLVNSEDLRKDLSEFNAVFFDGKMPLPEFKNKEISRYMVVWRFMEMESELYLSFMLSECAPYKVLRRQYKEMMRVLANLRVKYEAGKTPLRESLQDKEITHEIFHRLLEWESLKPLDIDANDYRALSRIYGSKKGFKGTPGMIAKQFIDMDAKRIRIWIERHGIDNSKRRLQLRLNNR